MKLYAALLAGLTALSQALPTEKPSSALKSLKEYIGLQADDVAHLHEEYLAFMRHEFPKLDWAGFQKEFPDHPWDNIEKDYLNHDFRQADRGPGEDWVTTGEKKDWLCPPGKVKEGGIDCYWTGTYHEPAKAPPSCTSRGGQYKKAWNGSGADWVCTTGSGDA